MGFMKSAKQAHLLEMCVYVSEARDLNTALEVGVEGDLSGETCATGEARIEGTGRMSVVLIFRM